MATVVPLFEPGPVQPRRPRSQPGFATARPSDPAQPVAQANQLVLTQQDRYVMLPGNIGLPATKFEAALAVFARNGIAPEQAATEGFCVAHTALAELELTGRPVVLTFKDGEFTVEAMPPRQSRWKRLMFWRR